MEAIRPYIPYFVPVLVIELILIIAGLIDLARRSRTRGPKWIWALIILFIQIIGPIIYFVLGRLDEE